MNWCIRQFTETEVAMNAVERVAYYAYEIKTEADLVTSTRPPVPWPSHGEIKIDKLCMRYAPDSPLVLKELSLSVQPREKIGIVRFYFCVDGFVNRVGRTNRIRQVVAHECSL